jgi:transposase InsO family protein
MPKVLREATTQISATKACSSFSTLSTVGVGIHWRNSSSFKWLAKMDLDYNRLFHQVDRGCPHQECFTQGIINFLEDIIARFGCPSRIVTDNASSFKSEPLVKFCEQFKISLIHSTPYYSQGNGLAESSNKSLIKLIKILLKDNKRAWDSKLKFALWADRVTTKKSLGTSPFQLVYGMEVVFPTQLALPVWKFFQDHEGEPDHMVKIIHQVVEVQQTREQVMDIAHSHQ